MNVIKNLRAIYDGLKNYHFPDPEIEKIAKERAEICASCPHANKDHPFKLLTDNGKIEPITGMGCDICHCLLSAKVRTMLTVCPEKKW